MKKIMTLAAVAAVTAFGAQASTLDYSRGGSESNALQLITENANVMVGSGALDVDYVVGTNLNVGDQASGVSQYASGFDLAGGTYDSHLVHFDPLGTKSRRANGTFTFSGDIVAIIVSNGAGRGDNADGTTDMLLNLSDALFGVSGATYEQAISRRSESNGTTGDTFTLATSNSLFVSLGTRNNFIDNIRVITESASPSVVPVPASLPLLLVGLGGLAAMRSRRNKA